MLKQLIYASQSVHPMSDQELLGLLQKARERNRRRNITGMLVYRDSIFLQALEGEEENVEATWAGIQADKRHHNIVEIRYVAIAERDFPDFSMGFMNLSHQDLSHISGYTPFMEEGFSPKTLTAKPGQALDFLLDMKYSD